MRKKDDRFLELMKLNKNNVVLYKDIWCVIFPKKFYCLNNGGCKTGFDMIQMIEGKLLLSNSDETTLGSDEAGYKKMV